MENLPAPLDTLIKVYQRVQRQVAKRSEFFQTEEGKKYNRDKAKKYYEANKATVLEKRRKAYEDPDTRAKILKAGNDYYKSNREKINDKRRQASDE